ncbi:MAG: hypothetical protein U0790_23045 [Isosphaeraceae bacterium]
MMEFLLCTFRDILVCLTVRTAELDHDTAGGRVMTQQQRKGRAEFIRDQPALWFAILYATTFFGGSVAIDLWSHLIRPSSGDWIWRYCFPLGLAVPQWMGLRGWAMRVIDARPAETGA